MIRFFYSNAAKFSDCSFQLPAKSKKTRLRNPAYFFHSSAISSGCSATPLALRFNFFALWSKKKHFQLSIFVSEKVQLFEGKRSESVLQSFRFTRFFWTRIQLSIFLKMQFQKLGFPHKTKTRFVKRKEMCELFLSS